MNTEGSQKKTSILGKWFPDRQVYFRSNGEVRFLTLSTSVQTTLASVLLGFAVWVIFSTAHVFTRDAVLEAKQETIEGLEAANAKQADDMNMLKRDIISRANNLEGRQTYLENLVEADPTGKLNEDENLQSTETGATETEATDTEATENDKGADASGLEGGLEDGAAFWAQVVGQPNQSPLPEDLDLREFLALVHTRFEAVETGQDSSAESLSLFAESQLLEADDMLAPFKLKALDLANAVEDDLPFPGQGGPFIPIRENEFGIDFAAAEDDTYYIPYPDLHESWSRLLKVYTGFRSLPISRPAADFYRSSPFGRRTDPVTKQSGWHPGVDLAGWKGTDVYSTETGVVVKAGHYGTYGKYIEIDHGNGFLTRYGHLSKITVKRGDTVNAGDVIGKMGCTGRCTGTHLHYEVVFNGKIRNPQIFMEAPEDVQETKRQSLNTDAGK